MMYSEYLVLRSGELPSVRPMHSENEVQNQNWRPVLWTVFCAKMVLADVLPCRFYKTLHIFEQFMLSIMPCIGL